MGRRGWLAVVAFFGACCLEMSPAHARAPIRPGDPVGSLTITPTEVLAGSTVEVTGGGCLDIPPFRFATAFVYLLRSSPVPASFGGEFAVAEDGSFGGRLTPPPGVPLGDYTARLFCVDGDAVTPAGEDLARLTVLAAPPLPPTTTTQPVAPSPTAATSGALAASAAPVIPAPSANGAAGGQLEELPATGVLTPAVAVLGIAALGTGLVLRARRPRTG